jgi:hypothetical protein
MRLSGDLEKQLNCTIQDSLYKIVIGPSPIVVEETAKDGRARVIFEPEGDVRCIEWLIQRSLFAFLKEDKNADGAFFVQRSESSFEAHIVECKRTINQDSWHKAKRQMRWTLIRLRALAGVLGIELANVVCYTAYCDDELQADSSPDPAESKISIGDEEPSTPEDIEDQQTRRRQFDWDGEEVHLRDFDSAFPHRKLPLQLNAGVGVGSCPVARSG